VKKTKQKQKQKKPAKIHVRIQKPTPTCSKREQIFGIKLLSYFHVSKVSYLSFASCACMKRDSV